MFGEYTKRLSGEASTRLRLGDHEGERPAGGLDQLQRWADRSEVVRAGPYRHQHQIGGLDQTLDERVDGGRGIDQDELRARVPELLQGFLCRPAAKLGELRRLGSSAVIPARQA